MITTSDIANILYADCEEKFRCPIYQKGNIPKGEVTEDRITIHPKNLGDGKFFEKCFVEVNISVPDDEDGEADTIRLQEYERISKAYFDTVSCYDGTYYAYKWNSIEILEDTNLRCHYVNIRILFEILK